MHEVWSDTKWLAVSEPSTTYSRTTLIKKNREANVVGVNQLVRCGLWSGQDFGSFESAPPATLVAILDVQHDTYNGVTRAVVNWISPDSDVPPGRGLRSNTPDELVFAYESGLAEAGDHDIGH